MTTTQVILTEYGNNKILDAIANDKNVYVAELVYGDGGGETYTPVPTQTTLVNPLGSVNAITRKFDPVDGFIYFSGTILSTAPAFTMRELGLFDEIGGLLAIGTFPATSKPDLSEGLEVSLPISLGFKTSAGSVLIVEPGGAFDYATKEWVEDNFQILSAKNMPNGYAGLDERGFVRKENSILSYEETTEAPNNPKYAQLKGYSGDSIIPYTDKLDRDLSDLSTIGADKLNVSKCYETGLTLSSDKDGYTWVERLAYSTYGNATKVGSPTISNTGEMQASSGNYVTLAISNINYPFVIYSGFTYTPVSDTRDIYSSDNRQIRLFLDPLRITGYAYDGTTLGSCVMNLETIGLQQGDKIWTKFVFENASSRTLYVSLDDGLTWSYVATNRTSLNLALTNFKRLDMGQFSASAFYPSIIDLSKTGIQGTNVDVGFQKRATDTYNINGQTVQIPYKLSKTGSKICHYTYRSRVLNVYQYEGASSYFTINGITNEFSMPCGELYGMISTVDSAVNAITSSILSAIYPIGAIYIAITATCPLEGVIGHWTKVSSGKVLQGADSKHAVDTTISAGLPNITGNFRVTNQWNTKAFGSGEPNNVTSGAFTSGAQWGTNSAGNGGTGAKGWDYYFKASDSSSVYNSDVTTVQPPAYVVNIWKRIS